MKVLVTGATGFIGRAIVLRLQRDRHDVLALVRSEARGRDRLGAGVELVPARPGSELAAAVERVDGVVNLAGAPIFGGRWTEERRRAIVDSRVGLTRDLVVAIGGASKRPRVLVSASAVGYYGDRGEEVLSDASAPGSGFLAEVCKAWEAAAEGASAAGVRVAIPRLGVVLGHDGGVLEKLAPIFRAGLGGPLGSGRQWVSWIHLHDLVEILVQALVDDRFAGPFDATAPAPVRYRHFARALGSALHRPSFVRVPAFAVRALLGDAAGAVLGSQRVRPSRLAELGFEHRFRTVDDAFADLLDPAAARISLLPKAAAPPVDGDYLRARPPRYLLRSAATIDAPVQEVFDFFSRPENLGALTPASMEMHIERGPAGKLHERDTFDYRLRVGPVPLRWRAVIARLTPGELFVDAQDRGPYRSWWHEHHFTAAGEGRTRVEDRVYYAPPLGWLGRVANRLFVAPALRRIFTFRSGAIELRFGRSSRE